MNPYYDFVIRKPREAAARIEELEAQLTVAIDWHWNESVAGTTRQEIIDNINELAKKKGK